MCARTCVKPGEDQAGRHRQRGRLRGHLGHHGERKDRKTLQRRIERRDLAAAQRVVLGDRIVVGVQDDERLDLVTRRPAGEPRRPRGRARART